MSQAVNNAERTSCPPLQNCPCAPWGVNGDPHLSLVRWRRRRIHETGPPGAGACDALGPRDSLHVVLHHPGGIAVQLGVAMLDRLAKSSHVHHVSVRAGSRRATLDDPDRVPAMQASNRIDEGWFYDQDVQRQENGKV